MEADLTVLYGNFKQSRTDLLNFKNRKEKPLYHQNTYSDENWCKKCFDYYNSCIGMANLNNLKVIGGLYQRHIHLSCMAKSHSFSIGYNRKMNASTLSCQDCKQDERDLQQQKAFQEEKERTEFLANKQQELFRQANMLSAHQKM